MAEDNSDLAARLEAIEKILEGVTARPQVTDITADDIKAFRKVRDAVAFDPDTSCGINECFNCIAICRVCRVCDIVCRVCDVECTCGPCNLGGRNGRGGRFGGLGQ